MSERAVLKIHSTHKNHLRINWGSAVMGALLCLGLEIGFALFGSGLMLLVVPLEQGVIPGNGEMIGLAIVALIGVTVSFFVGGAVSGYWAEQASKVSMAVQACLMWALVAVGIGVLGMARMFLPAPIFAAAGIGVDAGAASFFSELKNSTPSLVSDMSLIKGKIITQLIIGPASETQRAHLKGMTDDLDRAAKRSARTLRKTLAVAGLAVSLFLFIGCLFANLGSFLSARYLVTRSHSLK